MNDQMTLDEARARASDPETSHAAARSVGAMTEKRAAVLNVLRDYTEWIGGICDYSLIEAYATSRRRGLPKQSESGLRTRRAELVALGLVEDSGERVRLPSGRMAILWRTVA